MARSYLTLPLISRFQAEIDRLFQEALDLGDVSMTAGIWQPGVDIVETADALLILVEVPGLGSEDVTVEVEGSQLRIRGVKPSTAGSVEAGSRFHCAERGHGRFSRQIHLLWPVNTHRGRVRLRDGLLAVEFPRIQEQRNKLRALPIEIEDE